MPIEDKIQYFSQVCWFVCVCVSFEQGFLLTAEVKKLCTDLYIFKNFYFWFFFGRYNLYHVISDFSETVHITCNKLMPHLQAVVRPLVGKNRFHKSNARHLCDCLTIFLYLLALSLLKSPKSCDTRWGRQYHSNACKSGII